MAFNKAEKLKIAELSLKYGIDADEIELVLRTPYNFIREKTKELEFEDDLTREEFLKMKTNFNIPAIGKLYASHYLYSEMVKRKNKRKNLDKDSK